MLDKEKTRRDVVDSNPQNDLTCIKIRSKMINNALNMRVIKIIPRTIDWPPLAPECVKLYPTKKSKMDLGKAPIDFEATTSIDLKLRNMNL